MVLERNFKAKTHRRIRRMLPGCHIIITDANSLQGIPDTLILYRDMWAMLEFKRERPRSSDDFEPNQEWYIEEFDRMSFAACIYPENVEEVLNDLQHAFATRR